MKLYIYIFLALGLMTSCVSSNKMAQSQQQLEQLKQTATKLQKDSTLLANQADGLIGMLGYMESNAASISPEDKEIISLLEEEKRNLDKLQNDLSLALGNNNQVFVYRQGGRIRIELSESYFDNNQLNRQGDNILVLLTQMIKSEYNLEVTIEGATQAKSFHALVDWQESAKSASKVAQNLVSPSLAQNIVFRTKARIENTNKSAEIVLSYNRDHLVSLLENSNIYQMAMNAKD